QLFDLRADPGEVENLWRDPAHSAVKRGLLDELREWRIRSDCHTREWAAAWR
ncbi:arylsulfatase, partial [Candidatus Poribacteria bacterium]|nr:arylsulfatase [Candidatus Poribacteria bacterium]